MSAAKYVGGVWGRPAMRWPRAAFGGWLEAVGVLGRIALYLTFYRLAGPFVGGAFMLLYESALVVRDVDRARARRAPRPT